MKALVGKINTLVNNVISKVVSLLPEKIRVKLSSISPKNLRSRTKKLLYAFGFLFLGFVFLGKALDYSIFKDKKHGAHEVAEVSPEEVKKKKDEEWKKERAEKISVQLVDFKPFTLQTLDNRTLVLKLALECRTADCASYFSNRSGMISDEVIRHVSVSYSNKINSEEGKKFLKDKILNSLKTSKKGEDLIAIHFLEFLVQ